MKAILNQDQKEKEKEYMKYKKIVRNLRRGKFEKANFEKNSNSISKR